MTDSGDTIRLRRVEARIGVRDFDHPLWERAAGVSLTRYWSGEVAPTHRHAEARLIWTPSALGVRFSCPQAEPLIVSDDPQRERKSLGLWDRDVCEIFVAPEASAPEHYFEFEAAPTGEWLDLEIQKQISGRETNWEYASGMEAAGRISDDRVTVALRVPWAAFGHDPRTGDVWRANLFRCVGRDSERDVRGYLAWQPTYTERPSFHVPAVFGRLQFVD